MMMEEWLVFALLSIAIMWIRLILDW